MKRRVRTGPQLRARGHRRHPLLPRPARAPPPPPAARCNLSSSRKSNLGEARPYSTGRAIERAQRLERPARHIVLAVISPRRGDPGGGLDGARPSQQLQPGASAEHPKRAGKWLLRLDDVPARALGATSRPRLDHVTRFFDLHRTAACRLAPGPRGSRLIPFPRSRPPCRIDTSRLAATGSWRTPLVITSSRACRISRAPHREYAARPQSACQRDFAAPSPSHDGRRHSRSPAGPQGEGKCPLDLSGLWERRSAAASDPDPSRGTSTTARARRDRAGVGSPLRNSGPEGPFGAVTVIRAVGANAMPRPPAHT